MEDGIMKLTIHDCKRSIQLKNNLNDPLVLKEAIEKLNNLIEGIIKLKEFIEVTYKSNTINYLYT